MPLSFIDSPFATKREHEAYLHLPASRQSAAVSAAPKRTAALQVQLCHAQLSGKKRKADDTTKLVGLKGTSGRVVLCKVEAAKLSGMLADWLDTSVSSSWPSGDFTVPFSEEILTLLVSALESSLMLSGDKEQSRQLVLESARHLAADDFFALYAAAKFLQCEHFSTALCCHLAALLRGKSPSEIREDFHIVGDMSLEVETASLNEPVFRPPSKAYSARTRVAPGGALAPASTDEQPTTVHSGEAPQVPRVRRSLSARMGDEDSVQELLMACELSTLLTLKGVSFAWRERARLALSNVDSAWRTHTFTPRSELAAQLELSRMQMLKAQAGSILPPPTSESELESLRGGGYGHGYAIKRLAKEWLELRSRDRDVYIDTNVLTIAPVNDLFHWRCDILGVAGTPYAGGCFELELSMPEDYPNSHPNARFLTKILHPNVDNETGNVSMSWLEAGEWSPAMRVIKVVIGIVSLMDDPNFDSSATTDLARLHRDDPSGYERTVQEFTQKYAK